MSHTILDDLASAARSQFARCYTLSVEFAGEQVFLKDFDNISRASADDVFDQFKRIATDTEPAGTVVRMFSSSGELANFTVPA